VTDGVLSEIGCVGPEVRVGREKKGGQTRQDFQQAGVPRVSGSGCLAQLARSASNARHRPMRAGPRLPCLPFVRHAQKSRTSGLTCRGHNNHTFVSSSSPVPLLQIQTCNSSTDVLFCLGSAEPLMADLIQLKARTRADYPYLLEYRTRW
jgi:hypothetical protein